MFPPCEMMAKNFLPAVRGLVAHRLKKMGKGQTFIAKTLGITQSAVSQILASDERKYGKKLEELGLERREYALLVETISQEVSVNPTRATEILYGFWLDMLSKGRFCDYHRRMYPQLLGCEICLRRAFVAEFDEERTRILEALEKSVKRLEGSRAFAKLIPQVGTNVVACLERSQSVDDVAGVVGRIVRVDDGVKAVGRPAFGGSHHLALVLLTARRYNKSVKAAVNIINSSAARKTIAEAGIVYAVIEPHQSPISDETVLQDLENVFQTSPKFPAAVFHGGGVGYEPITYLFSDNLEKLIDLVLILANRISLS
ncbi:MAG: thiamine-phosphate synthase family protein [Candidatus Caldarchaeum sp.]